MGIRIIAGERKGKKLLPIPGNNIRPTPDRLRETIFNILSRQIRGARVLDLFSGSGALGIEALSRGALRCVFIDNDDKSLALIRANLESCGFEARADMIKWDIEKNLDCVRRASPAFNLAFMDPPYDRGFVGPALWNMAKSRCLDKEARVVAEHSVKEPIPETDPYFQVTRSKRYKKTVVSFLNVSRGDRRQTDEDIFQRTL